MHARIATGALLLAFLAPAPLSGCRATCDPQPTDATVTLTLLRDEVRTLPLLTSRATTLLGVGVPDSHGTLDVRFDVASDHVTEVDVMDLRLTVKVAGRDVPVRLLKVDGGRDWATNPGGDTWRGHAGDESVVTFWWTVDRDRSRTPTTWALDEGDGYTVGLDFGWRYEDCERKASGHVTEDFTGFVRASANAQAFEGTGTPTFEKSATGAGFRSSYEVTSGLEVEVTAVEAKAVFLGPGVELGLALFTNVAWTVDGQRDDTVPPGSVLATFSSASAGAGAYSASGTFAPPTSTFTGGLVILIVELEYRPTDGTPGSNQDVLAHGLPR